MLTTLTQCSTVVMKFFTSNDILFNAVTTIRQFQKSLQNAPRSIVLHELYADIQSLLGHLG